MSSSYYSSSSLYTYSSSYSSSSYHYPSSSYHSSYSSGWSSSGSTHIPPGSSGQSSSAPSSSATSSSSSGIQNSITITINSDKRVDITGALFEVDTNVPVSLSRTGNCWNSNSTITFACSGAQLYFSNGTQVVSGQSYSFASVPSLYLKATSASSLKGVSVSATAYPNHNLSSSSGSSSGSAHSGHSNSPCSDSDIGTAWKFSVTGNDATVVGQRIRRKASFAPIQLLAYYEMNDQVTFDWTISGSQPIAYYGPPDGKTAEQAMEIRQISAEDKEKSQLYYYCTGQAGQNIAQCRITIADLVDSTKQKTVTIQRPSVVYYQGNWTPLDPRIAYRECPSPTISGVWGMALGGKNVGAQNNQGITWHALAETGNNIPDGGSINIVQMVKCSIKLTYMDPFVPEKTKSTQGEFMLDVNYPYCGGSSITNHTGSGVNWGDSPFSGWTSFLQKIVRQDSFMTYLVFCPGSLPNYTQNAYPDNIYVTLGFLEWAWNGTATRQAIPNDPLVSGTTTPQTNITGSDSTVLPTWDDNAGNYIY